MTSSLLAFVVALVSAICGLATAALFTSTRAMRKDTLRAPGQSVLLRRLFVGPVATVALFALSAVGATTTVSARAFTYDVPALARVDVHHALGADAAETQQKTAREGSASPSAEGRSASTTSSRSFVATESTG